MATQAPERRKKEEPASIMSAPANVVQEYPISVALLVFGVGLGVGIMAGHALSDALAHAVQPPPTMTERLARQIYDVVSQAVPESVARRFAA